MNSRSVIVTGATGFIGSNLVFALIRKGFDVHILVRDTSDLSILGNIVESCTVHIYNGSIVDLKKTFSIVKPSHVFHLASLFLAQHDDSNITDLLESNIIFSTHVVEAMVSEGVPFLINTGTSWQHFTDDTYVPVNLYAATKEAFENILEFYIQTSNLKVTTLKLFDTYGPNDPRKKLLRLLHDISVSKDALSMSAGEQKINLVYIDDVIRAFEHAYDEISRQIELHSRYSVSSSKPLTLKELVVIFEDTLNVKLNINWGEREYRNREVMVPWSGEQVLKGWHPEIDLKTGLKRAFG
jgi:nucleoside-diphosphate-sugar epimerase